MCYENDECETFEGAFILSQLKIYGLIRPDLALCSAA
jgi:hypothetical protein